MNDAVSRAMSSTVSRAVPFVAATLFANQLGAVDLLVAGVLFSSDAVADYAIAARIAALFGFFQLAMLKRFAPRAGQLNCVGHRRKPPGQFDGAISQNDLRRSDQASTPLRLTPPMG